MEKVNDNNKSDINNLEEPSVTNTESNKKISVEELKQALESDIELKGYIDSLIDTATNKRLEKRLAKELKKKEDERLANEELEAQKQAEALKIKEYEKKIATLENTIKYKRLLEESGLNTDLIDFISRGTESESEVVERIKIFKGLLAVEVAKEVAKKVTENPPIPRGNEGGIFKSNKFW